MDTIKKKKRLLILTSATGAGHDTHAYAAVAWCKELYGDSVEVVVEHALEDSHEFYRKGVAFYNLIQRKMPGFHHVYYNIVELVEILNAGTVTLGRDYMIKLFQRVQPDAILSVMDCLNRGYFELAKSVLGPQVQCATFCTEFTAGYGFSRNWVNPRCDYYLARTDEVATHARRCGVPKDRALTIGHWAPVQFYAPAPTPEEKAAYLRGLDLDPDKFTLLLSTGGNGAQNHVDILRTLFPLKDRIQVIALCGRDEKARLAIDQWAKKEAPFAVRPLPFTNEMAKLFHVSSAVVARGGATSAGEILLCNCPVIFNALGLMMPQEIPTWRYFKARRMGFAAFRAGGVRPVVERWLNHPEEYAAVKRRMLEARVETTPREALEKLLG